MSSLHIKEVLVNFKKEKIIFVKNIYPLKFVKVIYPDKCHLIIDVQTRWVIEIAPLLKNQ